MPGTRAGPHDARLQNIDLREKIYTYDLSIVDADGAPVKELTLKSPSLQYPEIPYEPGFLVLATPDSQMEVHIQAPGYQALHRILLPGKHVLRMSLGLKVSVKASPTINLPHSALATILLVGVNHDEEVELLPTSGGAYSGTVGRPGTYWVRGMIWRRGKKLAELPLSAGASITIAESSETQAFTVDFDRAAFVEQIPPE